MLVFLSGAYVVLFAGVILGLTDTLSGRKKVGVAIAAAVLAFAGLFSAIAGLDQMGLADPNSTGPFYTLGLIFVLATGALFGAEGFMFPKLALKRVRGQ